MRGTIFNRYSRYIVVFGLIAAPIPASTVGVCGDSGEKRIAQSDQPFFETFSFQFAEKPVLKGVPIIAGQDPYAYPAQPSMVQAPDGRLFVAWTASIGFARGGRIVGAFSCDGQTWDAPIELINHPDRTDENPIIVSDGARLMVISDVQLLPNRVDKLNPWPTDDAFQRNWWYMTATEDNGKTWTKPREVKHPYLYASLRGGNGYRLGDGALTLPYYYLPATEDGKAPKYEHDMVPASGMAHSTDGGLTWTAGQPISIRESERGADEPATVLLSDGGIYCLLRTSAGFLYETRSKDGGRTWDPAKASPFPARNTPAWIHRLENRSGDELVVAWNYLPPWDGAKGRTPLVAAHSRDGGRSWTKPKLIAIPNPADGYRADYPTMSETKDGMIVMVWMQETLPNHLGKELRVARFNRAWLVSGKGN